jgi:hypothetical protein
MPARIPGRCPLSLGLGVILALGWSTVLAGQSVEVASDQDTPRSAGWHFSLGLGAGKADLTCEGCSFDSRTGFSGFLAVARAIRTTTLLGVEATAWRKEMSPDSPTWVYSVMPHLTQYLHEGGGPFLRGGLGLIGFNSDNGNQPNVYGIGLGFSGRLGYELAAGSVRVAPYLGFARSIGGTPARRDRRGTGVDLTVSSLQFGLSVAAP